jgi:hypothetical protein
MVSLGGVAQPGITGKTEFWNGTSWTEVADLGTARKDLGNAGTSTQALTFGGIIPPLQSVTEEWTAPDVVINTLTTS